MPPPPWTCDLCGTERVWIHDKVPPFKNCPHAFCTQCFHEHLKQTNPKVLHGNSWNAEDTQCPFCSVKSTDLKVK